MLMFIGIVMVVLVATLLIVGLVDYFPGNIGEFLRHISYQTEFGLVFGEIIVVVVQLACGALYGLVLLYLVNYIIC